MKKHERIGLCLLLRKPASSPSAFQEDLARKVDQLAKQESRNTSELFREAFRTYFAQQLRQRMKQTQQLAVARDQLPHVKTETRRLLSEAGQEMKSAKKK